VNKPDLDAVRADLAALGYGDVQLVMQPRRAEVA